MKVRLDFSLDAWINGVELDDIESLQDAKEQLLKMSLEEILEEGSVKDFNINEVDVEILEKKYKVKAFNIEYADPSEDLPKELVVDVVCAPEDLEDSIEMELYSATDELIGKFDYKILEEESEDE